MEQRRLRLGDILDDYCPRERRVTNHAVVALVEQDVKQTRCTTCDAEHVYKGGKAPRKKKATSTGALYKEVLAGIEDPLLARVPEPEFMPADIPSDLDSDLPALAADAEPDADSDDAIDDDSQLHMLPADEGPVHRPLIRAQLPRPEGMKIERQAPEFTIRQSTLRGAGFRGRGNPNGAGNGNGGGQAHGAPGHRFGRGANRGSGAGGGSGGGSGRGPQGIGRGRKRSR
jgi:hypothetical protein